MPNNARFAKILEPSYIGQVQTRNRMIKTGAGAFGLKSWYGELARGGVGLIIVGQCCVDETLGYHFSRELSRSSDKYIPLLIDKDEYIPIFSKLTQNIHKYGCPTFLQLSHWGPNADSWDFGLQPVSASALTESELAIISANEKPGFQTTNLPREATPTDIQEIIEKFVKAAERAREAGFDGVEIEGSSHGLVNSFISRVWNKRQDAYGCGDLRGRSRFLVEIVQGIKKQLGQGFPISVLYNVVEYGIEKGTTIEDSLGFAPILQEAGVDAIHVRAYGYGYYNGTHVLLHPEKLFYPEPMKPMPKDLNYSHKGAGATVPLAAAIKKEVSIPVIATGRLDHVLGDKVLREGKADFIGMLRRLVADPELPNKVAAGRLEDIAPCTACASCEGIVSFSQSRFDGDQCRINVNIASEYESIIKRAEKIKRVLVIGGGPAGMEAARVAAIRGHEVILYERDHKLGGLLPLAATVKGVEIEDLPGLVRYFKTQIIKLGVKIRLGQEVNPEIIDEIKPDVAILAVGGKQVIPDIPGVDRRKVVSNANLHHRLRNYLRFLSPRLLRWLTKFWMPIGKKVVIIGGAIQGCELAEFLIKRGRKVTIVDSDEELGEGLSKKHHFLLFPWLEKRGATMMAGVRYEEITDKGLTILTKEGNRLTIEADTVILAIPMMPNTDLLKDMEVKVSQVYAIGDCNDPGLIIDAIAEGHRIARTI